MTEPPAWMQPLLHSIESTVINLHEEIPRMTDNDVEYAYDKLANFYKAQISGKEVEEPLSTIDRRQDLMDEILNNIDFREEKKLDEELLNNPDVYYGEHQITNLPLLYSIAFKRLKSSARFWRKRSGPRGYLNFVSRYV
ncbi:MAG: hypothetical protein AAGJ18_19330 [Bacteroidota bacterium]